MFALLFFAAFAHAEIFVNGFSLDQTDCHYIKVEIEYALNRTQVYVDYGQNEPIRKRRVTDETGEKKFFISVADALNVFYRNGWKIKEIFIVPGGGSEDSSISGTIFYIFERQIE